MDNSVQDYESGIDLNASIVKFVDRDKENEVVQGNADVDSNSKEMVEEYVDIPVGDCVRDGVMPTQAQIAYLSEVRSKREKLKGKERTGTDR